ncbi:hypothetical protein O6H91_20G077100 [Diphasiastrum complanatum]|uniref:Uncharacterized protein n=1 Tax=Diphasiastrum complanatum TaxID=34168 RepID=A0ACC2ARZ8_DIPCM|nr:hypothetical protein O6H91_20G077100 [Diphasiastrum complanatum]
MAPPGTDAADAFSARDKVSRLLHAALDGDLSIFSQAAQAMDGGQGLAQTVVEVKDANGRGPLHFAARGGKDELCKYLLEEMYLPVDQRDNDGETPLIHAARQGHVSTAKCLLEHGADASATSNDLGTMALHHAAGIGSVDLIEILLNQGVDVDALSYAGSPLIWAVGHDKLNAVKALLDHHANPNLTADDDVTALLTAAAVGSLELVELLVQHGADICASAGGGVTPLHVAADQGDERIVLYLLKCGGDPNVKDDEGSKPIQVAAAKGNRHIVEHLLLVTDPDPSVSEWTTDGLLAHVESISRQEEANTNNVTDTGKKGTEGSMLSQHPTVEPLSPENAKRVLEAKARGDEAFKKMDYMLAVDAYTQALDFDPKNVKVLSNRSLCWIKLGQAVHALADAKAARESNPTWSKVWYREGAALRLLERYEEAADAFYQGVKCDPENRELVNAFREAVEAGRQHYKQEKSQVT